MESVGFKEWAVVCEALGSGRQSVILRKGGIAEGREGFSFKHREFFLFPTWFHEQPQKVRESGFEPPQHNGSTVPIRFGAQMDVSRTITSWPVAEALAPLHILQDDVIRERFNYDEAPGLHVAFVRVFQLEPAWDLPNESKYGGCRSWVKLPELPAELHIKPVISDEEHIRRRQEFLTVVEDGSSESAPAGSALY
jgi:hypothetical protein